METQLLPVYPSNFILQQKINIHSKNKTKKKKKTPPLFALDPGKLCQAVTKEQGCSGGVPLCPSQTPPPSRFGKQRNIKRTIPPPENRVVGGWGGVVSFF